jgi:hypothetical protein
MQLPLSKTAFWDTPLENINEQDHADFIITRVFQYGLINDIKQVLRFYSASQIIHAFRSSRGIDEKAIALAATVLGMKNEELR